MVIFHAVEDHSSKDDCVPEYEWLCIPHARLSMDCILPPTSMASALLEPQSGMNHLELHTTFAFTGQVCFGFQRHVGNLLRSVLNIACTAVMQMMHACL